MQPQRQTMTDNLADIIHIIHLGQRSGTLTVERGEDRNVEEGLITFIHGRVVEAKAGQQSGAAAFNYLNTWRKCRFAFVNHLNEMSTSPAPSSHLPYPKSSNTAKNTSTAHPPHSRPTTPAALIGPPQQNGRSPFPAPGPLRLPAGDVALQHPENTQLPRTHRRLLLLLDGKRTKGELARLLVRNLDELQTMLDDLERMGLIQQ